MNSHPVLIADIGATHARFAYLDDISGAAISAPVVFPTSQHNDAVLLIDDAMKALALDSVAACCLAVAGPVAVGVGKITNGTVLFSEQRLAAHLDCRVKVVNDFYALAVAIPQLTDLLQIGGADPARDDGSLKAVIGPGSGLGMSFIVPQPDGQWLVMPSEGGHADIAPGGLLEQEILGILQRLLGSVCWESVLSGPGLINLYRAVCELWGVQPDNLSAQQISSRGVEADEPVCHQTLEVFFGWLGAAAGNLALTLCARGGVYIGGGIVPRLSDFAVTSPMRRHFDERCELESYVADIPLYLILDENPGLLGARACLEQLDLS